MPLSDSNFRIKVERNGIWQEILIQLHPLQRLYGLIGDLGLYHLPRFFLAGMSVLGYQILCKQLPYSHSSSSSGALLPQLRLRSQCSIACCQMGRSVHSQQLVQRCCVSETRSAPLPDVTPSRMKAGLVMSRPTDKVMIMLQM